MNKSNIITKPLEKQYLAEKQKIILYHFTSIGHMGKILSCGELSKGDVPINAASGYNAVWFTVKSNVDNTSGMLQSNANKTNVRITFEFNLPTPNLYYWKDIAPKIGIERKTYQALDRSSNYKARDWWIYAGIIPLSCCKNIEYRLDIMSEYEPLDVNGQLAKEWIIKSKKLSTSFSVPNVTFLPFPSIY